MLIRVEGSDLLGRACPGTPGFPGYAGIHVNAVPADVLAAAVASNLLVGRLGLTDAKGHPRCASVRPPAIAWTAETA